MKTILCFSGLDPTGGAGISADIEALAANGCYCAPIVTALTIQDSHNVKKFTCVNADIIAEQADAVIHDMTVSAIKIGMIGNIEIAKTIHGVLKKHPHIPVILDPVLAAGGGGQLASDDLADFICKYLLPLTTIITPNINEANALTHTNDAIKICAQKLLTLGTKAVLITGTHADTNNIINALFIPEDDPVFFECSRLPHHYHGSGCTLAASLAAFIAKGFSIHEAAEKSLNYTWQTLKHGHALGSGQLIPNRFFERGK